MNGIFGVGIAELFFIAIIALVVLGPERLPGTMREVAKYFRMARNLSGELTSQFGEELKALDDINPQKILQEVMEDPALDDINPKKIVKDLSDDQKKGKKKSTTTKSAAKKPARKKSAPKKTAPAKTDAAGDGEPESDSAAASVTAASAASRLLAKKTSDADIETIQADESIDASTLSSAGPADESATASESVSTSDSKPAPPPADATVDDGLENRIAPDDLAANLEEGEPDATALPSEPASLSVNGTHDSVEDRA